MADKKVVNYPDVLGYITGGDRVNISVVQLAMAIKPRIVRAGRALEVLLLVQNASDVDIDVAATLGLPDRDAKKQKDQFVARNKNLVIGLEAGEVGYLTLPVTTLPSTAVGQDYKISMEVKVEPVGKGKPNRVRLPDGGAAFDPSTVSDESREIIEGLKAATFRTEKVSSLMGGTSLVATFNIMGSKVGSIPDLKPGWQSIWTLADFMDDRVILLKFREAIKTQMLPALDRNSLFKPLLRQTGTLFSNNGFKLDNTEAIFITKLLTLIVEYSSPQYGAGTQLTAGKYNVLPLLDKKRELDHTPNLPKWVSAMLRLIYRNEQVLQSPAKTLVNEVYLHLLMDAVDRGFEMIEVATGENLGSKQEREVYAEQIASILDDEKISIDFTHVYMPLVLGGIVAYDQVMVEGEDLGDLLHQMQSVLEKRLTHRNEGTEPIFKIASTLIDQALMKYGFRPT